MEIAVSSIIGDGRYQRLVVFRGKDLVRRRHYLSNEASRLSLNRNCAKNTSSLPAYFPHLVTPLKDGEARMI